MQTTELQTHTPVRSHPGIPVLGNLLAFARNPLAFLGTMSRVYDRAVWLTFGPRRQLLLMRPDETKYVMQENNRNYVRSPAFSVLKLFLGDGLLTSDGDFWRRQRRLAQPAFHRQRLATLAQTMLTETTDWLDGLDKLDLAQPVNLTESFTGVTLRIVCKTLFGSDVQGNLRQLSYALETLNRLGNARILNPIRFPMSWPVPQNVEFRQQGRIVDKLIYGFIETRRRTADSRDDLLDMLLNATDEETGEQMSDTQLRDECVTLFTAGHETSATAMAWTTWLVAQHPNILHQMQTEVDEALAGQSPTPEVLRNLPLTSRVIQESMRLYPPAWIMSRTAVVDDQVGDIQWAADTTVMVSPYILHRNPEHWPDPERFDPDRFLPDVARTRPAWAYLPFGGGPRLCIGQQFALQEMQFLLALLVHRFDLATITDLHPGTRPLITLRSKRPVLVRLTRRD
jgi:cytochrome P450